MESEYQDKLLLLGSELNDLATLHAEWSQMTFGADINRGPEFALKHLEKEAKEAREHPDDVEEFADCLLLILDASRRAGITPLKLIQAAKVKLDVNRSRTWNDLGTDEPVAHVR